MTVSEMCKFHHITEVIVKGCVVLDYFILRFVVPLIYIDEGGWIVENTSQHNAVQYNTITDYDLNAKTYILSNTSMTVSKTLQASQR